MGDSDSSSGAAQSAQSETGTIMEPSSSSFLARVFGALSPANPAITETPDREPRLNGHGMVNLRRLRVEDVAIPKAEITAVPDTITLDELVEVFKKSGLTRVPVFEGTLDQPVGFAHLKDIALQHGFTNDDNPFDLSAMLRPLLFVPPSMAIGVLLTKMQTERRHMALVIDEYGGTDGLVTIEDLIEQVVGEIEDEHDVDEADPWRREQTGSFVVFSRAPLPEFETVLGRSLTGPDFEEEVDTLGGLVFVLTGRVPARGEVVPHPEAGVEFEILDADARRIKRLRVRLIDNVAQPD